MKVVDHNVGDSLFHLAGRVQPMGQPYRRGPGSPTGRDVHRTVTDHHSVCRGRTQARQGQEYSFGIGLGAERPRR